MLSLSNVEEGKEEWNMSVAHIVIPMINGEILSKKDSEKMNSNPITLNTVTNGDQTVLTNGLEHNLVIGMDRNFFETHQTKTDLFIIQNPDLKLLQCNSDLKNSVAYTLSYVDQEKSEIIWESPAIKDKSKLEWCSRDKAVFEVKDVLNYGPHDSSKNWQDDLSKTNEQLNLDGVGGELAKITKSDNEIFIQMEAPIPEDKNVNVYKNEQFLMNFSGISNYQAVSLLSNSVGNTKQKTTKAKNDSIVCKKSLLTKDKMSTSARARKSNVSSSVQDNQGIEITPKDDFDKLKRITLLPSNNIGQHRKDLKRINIEPLKNKFGKLNKCDDVKYQTSSSLPEKSLPLKKKAKMKKTVGLLGPDAVKVKQEVVKDKLQSAIDVTEKKSKKVGENEKEISLSESDSDEPLINVCGRRKKLTKCKIKSKQEKLNKTNLVNQSYHEVEVIDQKFEIQESEDVVSKFKIMKKQSNFERKKFGTIFELLDDLKKLRMINASVWQTLCSGLEEMDADILKEMNVKCDNGSESRDSQHSYSAQLKAFALVLYFKQPAAFHYLSKLYKNGWPSLNIIKDWKRQVNSHPRRNFTGINRRGDNDVLK